MAADFMKRTTLLAHTAPVVEQPRLLRLILLLLAASYSPWFYWHWFSVRSLSGDRHIGII